ncbi:MAG: hypothetical protein JO040_05170, partial [Gemmatimonadetes bacterium]|nr:hypothetical protein [Gemmatimonadota bacterium]
MPLPNDLGNKAPGQLIRSQDWNALVTGVDLVEATLNHRVDQVEESVAARFKEMEEAVAARFEAVGTRLSAVEDGVARVDQRLTEEVEGLRAAIRQTADILGERIDGVETGLRELYDRVEPLLRNYRVTLQTERLDYALGELVELTAHVDRLDGGLAGPRVDGGQVVATDAPRPARGERPWVDFVSTWGQFR